MIFQSFQNCSLSALGYGLMRLPVLDGDNSTIDEQYTRELIAAAMKGGINYYDTAWGYHGGNSETVIGKILSDYPRGQFYLASKFPGYDVENLKNHRDVFERQLEKCRTDYFDFYLFHTVSDNNIDGYLNPEYGLMDYLWEQKQNGRIRHLGFSTHGSLPVMKRFLDAYADKLEFCQIQLNWLDWFYQDAKKKCELIRSYHLPIWVMEPLRGGKLADLTDEESGSLREVRDMSMPAWAFRFLQAIPDVTMILSGMSTREQLEENLKIFSTRSPLNKTEMETLLKLSEKKVQEATLPCTACRYCTPGCPMGLDIPELLKAYNAAAFSKGEIPMPAAIRDLPEEKRPSACIACRSCEAVCPQNILISEALAEFAGRMKSE